MEKKFIYSKDWDDAYLFNEKEYLYFYNLFQNDRLEPEFWGSYCAEYLYRILKENIDVLLTDSTEAEGPAFAPRYGITLYMYFPGLSMVLSI